MNFNTHYFINGNINSECFSIVYAKNRYSNTYMQGVMRETMHGSKVLITQMSRQACEVYQRNASTSVIK